MPQPDINPTLDSITSSLFRVSAKLLVIQDSKLLVVHEQQGWFGLPGGGVDHGENIIEGLAREISEELGCQVGPTAVMPLPTLIDSATVFDGIPRLTLFYEQVAGAVRLTPRRVELDYRWVTLEELSTLPLGPNIDSMRQAIRKLLAENYDMQSSSEQL